MGSDYAPCRLSASAARPDRGPLMRIAFAFFGAALMVTGVAARIVAGRHHPQAVSGRFLLDSRPAGWPATTYEVVRVASFALLIFGAVIVALALIRELRRTS
jgi:hypothetical protein